MTKKLQFMALGGADKVGQSCFLLGDGERWVLLDCGLSLDERRPPDFEALNAVKDRLIAVLISHAHLDHVGGLPSLFAWIKRKGWRVRPVVLSTPLTKKVSEVLLRLGGAKGADYSEKDLDELFSDECWRTLHYDDPQERRVKEVAEGIFVHFLDANHIPGSASIVINWDGFFVLYTGDCCHLKTRLLRGMGDWGRYRPAVVISESTYGQEVRLDPDEEGVLAAEDKLIKAIRETLRAGGRVLIPVFPFSRAEEIMLAIAEGIKRGRIPRVNCYSIGSQNVLVNVELSEVTKGVEARSRAMAEYAGKLALIRDTFSQVPLTPDSDQELLALCADTRPAVIIAADGGFEGASGILARKILEEPNGRILMAACSDEDSPAICLLDNIDMLKCAAQKLGKGEEQLKAATVQVRFRSHIFPKMLAALLKALAPKTVVLVHGTREAQIHLGNLLSQEGISSVYVKPLQPVHIDCETGKAEVEPSVGQPEAPLPQEKAPPLADIGRDIFNRVKRWLYEASGLAALRVSEIDPPVFIAAEGLRGTVQPGYYQMRQIWINPEIPKEALEPFLAHTAVHYIMDVLKLLPKGELSFREQTFVEGVAEYVAFQLTGRALTDCVGIGDDGKEHPADRNPYSEGFRKLCLVEKLYGKGKVAELIVSGSASDLEKALAREVQMVHVPEVAPATSVQPPQERQLFKPARRQLLGKGQKVLLIAGIAAVILLFFFFSDLFLPTTVEPPQVFSVKGLPDPLPPGEYSFRIIARVTEAPELVNSCLILSGNCSFSRTDQAELVLEGSRLPREWQVGLEDYNGDGYTDWVARGTWEFFENGNITIPARLRISGEVGAVHLFIESKILPRPTVRITFSASGIDPEEWGYAEILRVDDQVFYLSDLPKEFSWEFGSTHTYCWASVAGEGYQSRFRLREVSGLLSEENATLTVPSVGGNISATYYEQFFVTTFVYGDGSINLPPESWQDAGATLSLTATPAAASVFKYWIVNDETVATNPLQITVNQSLRIECYFNRVYRVEFNCDFKGRTLTPILRVENATYYPTELPKAFVVEEGASLSYEWYSPVMLPTNNTRVVWLSTSGLAYSQEGVVFPFEDGVVFANYTREYLVRLNATEGGNLYPEAGIHWYPEGEEVIFEAYPYVGYSFGYWLVNGVKYGSTPSLSIKVTKPLDITAVFQKSD